MKICILSDDFAPHTVGGAGVVATALARGLKAQGYAITVITSVQNYSLAGTFEEGGIRIERLYSEYPQRWRSWRSLYNPSTVSAIRRILEEVKPDVVHAHNVHFHLSYESLRLAKKCGATVVLTAHDVMSFHYGKLTEGVNAKECNGTTLNYRVNAWQQFQQYRFWYNPLRNSIIKSYLKYVDRIFAVSGALREAMIQNGISNVEVLHNGINLQEWQDDRASGTAFREKFNLIGKKVILFGGRISTQKGARVMLEAMRRVVVQEPEAVLGLLGKRDEYVRLLEQQAAEWGIGTNVVSFGWLSGDEWHAAYHTAAVVCVPSLYLDPFPTMVLEAMACGKPVVGSTFGGIPEMVVDGKTGYVVNPLKENELSGRLIELLSNAETRRSFGLAAQRRAAEFDVDTWVARTVAAYSALLCMKDRPQRIEIGIQ